MAYSFAHYCPNCGVPSDVYVNESRRPKGSSIFRYRCASCRQMATYSPFLFLSKSSIPPEGIVAMRCGGESTRVMARGFAHPKPMSHSALVPVLSEMNQILSVHTKNP
jgi:hypothetical protein